MGSDIKSNKSVVRSTLVYGFLTVSFLILILVAIRFLTIEADEAWMLLSVGQLAGGPFAANGVVSAPAVTSGGLYAAIHYPLMLAGQPIEVHRLISFVFAGLTLVTVYMIVRAQHTEMCVGLLGVVAFMTVPGFLLQAGMATAEMTSTFLLIAGAWYWTKRGNATLAGSVMSGILFGLSSATRMSALIALPAIVVWAPYFARSFRRPILHTLVACVAALAIFILSTAAYYLLFRMGDSDSFVSSLGVSTGVFDYRDISSWLAYFLASENLFPIVTLVVSALALALAPPAGSFAAARPLCVLLLLIGVIGWVAWIVKAPIPHLRYLWPALPALWLCGTLLLLGWLTELGPGRSRLLLQAAVASVWTAQFAISFREVYDGDSLAVVYEAVGRAPIKSRLVFFRARQEQNEFATLVSKLPSDVQICALKKEVSYPITFLSGRKIQSISDVPRSVHPVSNCAYLVMFPSDKNIWVPTLSTQEWIRSNTKLYSRLGDYSVYEINPGAPQIRSPLDVRIGEQEHP